MSEPRLPPDIEDLLALERERPAESPETLGRIREHLSVTLGPGIDGGGGPSGGDGTPPAAPAGQGSAPAGSAGVGASPLLGKLTMATLTAFTAGAVAGAGWQASRQTAPTAPTARVEPIPAVAATDSIHPALPPPSAVPSSIASSAPIPLASERRAPSTDPRPDPLMAERTLIDVARTAAARGRTDEALTALETHARRFPKGALAEEREGLRIQTLSAAGRAAEAREKLAQFKKAFPRSLLLPVMEAQLGPSAADAGGRDEAEP